MRISDWSSDVCSSDLIAADDPARFFYLGQSIDYIFECGGAAFLGRHAERLMNEKLGNECVAEEIRISGSLLRGCRVGFEAGGTGPPFVGRAVVENAPVAIFGAPPGIRVGQIEAGREPKGGVGGKGGA